MSNHLNIAAEYLKSAVLEIEDNLKVTGHDASIENQLRVAEAAALVSIAYSLAGGKTKGSGKPGSVKIENLSALNADEAAKKLGKDEA